MKPAGAGVITLLTVGLLLSACGSSSSSTSSASPSPSPSPSPTQIQKVDACSLVTVAEASTAAGTSVTSLAGAGVSGACIYASSDGKASVLVFAQAYPDKSTADAVSPEQMAAALNGAYGIANAKVVTGVGDKAVEYSFTSSGTTGIVIFVFKSNVVMMIAVAPATDSTAVELLAKTAVGRL